MTPSCCWPTLSRQHTGAVPPPGASGEEPALPCSQQTTSVTQLDAELVLAIRAQSDLPSEHLVGLEFSIPSNKSPPFPQ